MFKKEKLLNLLERKTPLLKVFCGSSLEKCQLISVELWIDPLGIECNTKTQAVLSQFLPCTNSKRIPVCHIYVSNSADQLLAM